MVTFDRLYTYDRPRNKTMLLIDTILKFVIISGVILFAIWVVSEVLLRGTFLGVNLDFLKIDNPFGSHPNGPTIPVTEPVPVYFAYIGVGIGLVGGLLFYAGPMVIDYLLAPPGGKLRVLVVDDDAYADTTYECGETPIGTGQAQINLQYYSFALVFIMFDIITALTLMFAVVFSSTSPVVIEGIAFTPTFDQVVWQIGAILFFVLSPLLVLGLWLHKKAILWQ